MRCSAAPGPPDTVTVPGLWLTTSLRSVLHRARDKCDPALAS